MSMKKTDLEKNKMLKADNHLRGTRTPDRFGSGSALPDKKEQRRLDQAAGLVPFACKLHADLVKTLHAEAQKREVGMNELVAELITKGLGKKK